MKQKSLYFLFLLFLALLQLACKKTNSPSRFSPTTPLLATLSVSNITQNTAQTGGEISSDGGMSIIARGVCWSISQNPTTADDKKVDTNYSGSDTGKFTIILNELKPGTTYYLRAYAMNSVGTAYGNSVSFTTSITIGILLTTDTVNSITQNTARSGGNILSDSGSQIIARGVCWGTSQNPTIADNKTLDTNYSGSDTGKFIVLLSQLAVGTTYYLRAYATNSVGTAYGNDISFTTLAASLPVLTTDPVNSITQNTARSGGNILSDSGSAITAYGVCWGTNPNPTTADFLTSDGCCFTGNFNNLLTNLIPLTTYYVRAYATSSAGTAYGNEISFTSISNLTAQLPILSDSVAYAGVTFIRRGNNSVVEYNYIVSVDIQNDGGSAITAEGILVYNKNSASDPPDSIPGHGISTTGKFTVNFGRIMVSGHWLVIPFATNSTGTGYGNAILSSP
jgi:hypothetical protein